MFTVSFFLVVNLKRLGAISLGVQPCNQPSFQKFIFKPFPSMIVVQAANRRRSVLSHGVSVPTHAFCGAVRSCHSHRSRSALAKRSRSRIPRPPLTFGRQDLVQLTLHFQPVRAPSPAQRKRFRILSMSSRRSFDVLITVSKYTGCDDSTDLVRQTRPAWVKCRPYHPEILAAAFSTRGRYAIFRSRLTDNGSPRNFNGKFACLIGTFWSISRRLMLVQLIGVTVVLLMFVWRPVV